MSHDSRPIDEDAIKTIRRVMSAAFLQDIPYPNKFGRSPSENFEMGYKAAQRAVLTALKGDPR